MNCLNCNIEFDGRTDAKFCSPRCRVTFNRKASVTANNVTDNVTFSEPAVTDNFEFYTITKAHPIAGEKEDKKSAIRQAKYWYNVPLGAIPVMKKDWPKMPEYMNGRQYFLWWMNEFKVHDDPAKGEVGSPIIHNPYPVYDRVEDVQAGEQSRRWGA